MNREYHKWLSPSLGREMELLVFGEGGLPAIVFPTSCGRFYQFEDEGMVAAVAQKIEHGELQLFCVDSVDNESWYAENVPGRWRIARHMQYEQYVLDEVVARFRRKRPFPHLAAVGCSFGGFHAASMALRHPDIFTAMLSMGGAFDVAHLLRGHYDEDCHQHLPMDFLSNLSEPWYLDKYRRNNYTLATGVHDMCWDENERLAELLKRKGVPVRLDVWGDNAGHDWTWWRKMLATYL
jgi:esterase/lipase superfamily enzyme